MTLQGVFNVTDFNVLPGNTDTTNTTNLRTLVSTLLDSTGPTSGKGGTIQFPSVGIFKFNGTITIGKDLSATTQPYSILIEGTGEGSESAPILQMNDGTMDLFLVDNNTTDDQNVGGVVFQDLQIFYSSPSSTPGAAVHARHSQNVRIERATFQDCGIVYENATGGLVRACTFLLNNQNNGAAIAVVDSGSHKTSCNQMLIDKCDIRGNLGMGVTNNLIAVNVTACKHCTIRTVSASGINQGILLAPSSTAQNDMEFTLVDDCQIGSASAALTLKPASSTGSNLNDTRISNSSFQQGNAGTYTGGGIYIDIPSSGSNSQTDTIRIVSCTSQGWQGPGIQIAGGQNIQVVGGNYSGNGSSSSGVSITGAAANISFVGTDLSASYLGGSAQLYAVIVSGSPTSPVLFKDCVMLGYTGALVNVTGAPTKLQVINCAGYNDINTNVSTAAPLTSKTAASLGYYGQSLVAFSNTSALTITVSGTAYSMSFGTIPLLPYDTIQFSSSPLSLKFTWLGK